MKFETLLDAASYLISLGYRYRRDREQFYFKGCWVKVIQQNNGRCRLRFS